MTSLIGKHRCFMGKIKRFRFKIWCLMNYFSRQKIYKFLYYGKLCFFGGDLWLFSMFWMPFTECSLIKRIKHWNSIFYIPTYIFINYEKILSKITNIHCSKKYKPVQTLPVLMQIETFFYLPFR